MIGSIGKLMFLAAVLAAIVSCKGNNSGGIISYGDITVNGPAVTGTVNTASDRMYTLRSLQTGTTYTLRTGVGAGDTLIINIYTSEADFKNGKAAVQPVETPVYAPPYDTMHEVVFNAPIAGDYVVIMSGTSGGGFTSVPFYNLRLMSSAAGYVHELTTSTTSTTVPASYTSGTVAISPGYMHVYSSPIATAGFSISLYSTLVSTTTTTVSYPQLFVYGDMYNDHGLTIRNLLYSITSNTMEFTISSFVTSTTTGTTVYTTTTSTSPSSSAVISSVTFTGSAPFILLKGVVQANYTLTVSP